MSEQKKQHSLTPNEEARAKEMAYEAFMREMGMRFPKEQPRTSDLVHENPRVVNALIGTIGLLPAVLALIAIAAILISSDKTMSAFYNGVSNKDALWGAWAFALSVCGVVMTEGALVYAEFAVVRERLKKGLPRRVWNVKAIRRSIDVRLGNAPPLDYHEMPDAALMWFSRLIFAIVLAANVYGGLLAVEDNAEIARVIMAVGLGVAGAFSLRFIGAQLAHLTYELVEQRNRELMADIENRWRGEMDRRWEKIEDELTRRAMHRAFVVKNDLALDAQSPYLLTAGEDGEMVAVPFQQSKPESQDVLWTGSNNGNSRRH